jgi:hypothetical protein
MAMQEFSITSKIHLSTVFHIDMKDLVEEAADSSIYLIKEFFFAVTEISGIIDNDSFFSGKYFQDYVKEGEKLSGIG